MIRWKRRRFDFASSGFGAEETAIAAVVDRLPLLRNRDLGALAVHSTNDLRTREARRLALEPEVPRVVEALAAMDAVELMFSPGDEFDEIDLPVAALRSAMRAARDAVAAVYAARHLHQADFRALIRPWCAVFGRDALAEQPPAPDVNDRADRAGRVLPALEWLLDSCHDPVAATAADALAWSVFTASSEELSQGESDVLFALAATERFRAWRLIRRTAERLTRTRRAGCACGETRRIEAINEWEVSWPDLGDAFAFAAGAWLVADVVPDDTVAMLTAPLCHAIPLLAAV